MKLLITIMIVCLSTANAANFTAKIYEQNSNKSKLLYTLTHKEVINGKMMDVTNTYQDTKNVTVVEEIIKLEGDIIHSFILNQKQINKAFQFTRTEKVITFSEMATDLKKNKSEELDQKLPTISGPATVPLIKSNWEKLLKGETIETRFAALERLETVGFKFFKEEEKILNGKNVVVIKMKPTSFVIAALVKPVLLTFDKEKAELIELTGRTVPKILIDGDWKDLDAEITYHY